MFRYYGIPARCVEGFLVTKDDAASMAANRPLTLTGQSGHTWVEYYQDGVGWLPFEVAPPYLSVMEQAESYQNVSAWWDRPRRTRRTIRSRTPRTAT